VLPSLTRPPHGEQTLLVIAAHRAGSETAKQIEYLERARTARDQIPHEDEFVFRGQTHPAEQQVELPSATMDITNQNCSRHAAKTVTWRKTASMRRSAREGFNEQNP
jgi:hypothetical protein